MNYNYDYRRDPVLEPAQLHSAEDVWHPHTTQKYMLGCKCEFNDGRLYRYCSNGAVALTAGYVNQQAAGTANWQNEVQTNGTAASIGDTSIKIAVSTAPTANQWDNGYLTIEDGTGEGQMYVIKEHTLTTTPTIQIADTGGIRVATAVTSEVTVTKNLYKDVVVSATNPTGIAVGVNPVAVTASTSATTYYFWSQVRGPAAVVVDDTDTIVVGDYVAGSASVAGACALMDAAADDVPWGRVMRAAATGETALIYLTIE